MNKPKTFAGLLEENELLRHRLEEAAAVVEAIRDGIVDAVVVHSAPGESVYTLEGADRPYRLLVEAMHQGVAVLNQEGVLLYCNPCLAQLFNMSIDKVIGRKVDDLVAGNVWSRLAEIATNKIIHEGIELHRDDGESFPALLALSALPLRKFCLLITDLSQQKRFEELVASKAALLESEIRYRRLFETAKDGILILDTHTGRITDANPFMSELLGYSHEHFLDKELWEIGLFSDKVANETAVRTLQRSGYIRYEHLPLETQNHQRVEVEVIANSYRQGAHSVIQCNIRDITERSRLELKLHEQAATLEDLHRRKDEFLAMLGHELRNPLAPISNAVQLLRLQKTGSPLQEKAGEIIERQVGQLARIVDDLLEVSRITTGKIHLQQERVALKGIVEHGAETVRTLISQRKHELKLVLPTKPIWLFADAARLEQVVVNLLTNAAKYTKDGGNILVTLEQENNEALIRVRDSGVGIAPELLPHVFDLFTQAERSLDRSQGGLGIGLCLVQRLVELHGGRVQVSSTLGQGSEFVVRIPVMEDDLSLTSSKSDDATAKSGSSLRILVVDDNLDAAETLKLLLTVSGHEVYTAHDGPAAIVVALAELPDVVLLDIGLPGLDGYEVAKRLRSETRLKHLVLVAMTGYGQESDRRHSLEAGFDHHLVKPVEFKIVEQIFSKITKKVV